MCGIGELIYTNNAPVPPVAIQKLTVFIANE